MEIVGILVTLKIINSKSNPSYKIAWIIPVLTIPIFGTLFYLIFAHKPNRKTNKRLFVINEILSNNLKQNKNLANKIKEQNLDLYNQSTYLINNKFPIYENTYSEYLEVGETYYKKLIEELKKAKHYIFLEYFIIQEGKMWNSILEILKQKVREGVDVRVIYDDIGCIVTLPSKYYRKLKNYGIKAVSFNQFVPILTSRLNNRDHRKILIIDGYVGFTGGVNLADEYINEKERFGHWKDNGVLIKGDAVWSLTVMFLITWDYVVNKKDDFEKFKPNYYNKEKIESNGYVQPYYDSPLDNEMIGKNVYLNLINKAKKSIYITTPYLIIDDELDNALCLASKNGVNITIITPGIADKKIVNEVTKEYYPNLLENGIKIYEYEKGFIHGKTFLVDDEYATVGTVNLDYRSLYLHFECGVVLYETDSIKDIKKDINNIINNSKEILYKDTKINFFKRLKRALFRIFSPLM